MDRANKTAPSSWPRWAAVAIGSAILGLGGLTGSGCGAKSNESAEQTAQIREARLARWQELSSKISERARTVARWEASLQRLTVLAPELDSLAEPDEAIADLSSELEWGGAGVPLFAYIPFDELTTWLEQNLPLSDLAWWGIANFVQGGLGSIERDALGRLTE